MYDVIIVGGGTAGLSAAIYTSRAGKSTLLFEKQNCGGQIVNSPEVENYPGIGHISGSDFSYALYEQAKKFGTDMKFEEVDSIGVGDGMKLVSTKKGAFRARSVIIASGAQRRRLGLHNEVEFVGKGISYCATCDGPFFRGKTVAVVGGGNTALDDALYLSEICETVYLIHRRNEFRGNSSTLEKLSQKQNVRIVLNSVVTAVHGTVSVNAITVGSTVGAPDKEIKLNGVFVAIGSDPDTKPFADIIKVDPDGYFDSPESCVTSTPGIFVAGDCRRKKVRQLATAAADGVVAATAAVEYLEKF